MNWKIVEFKTGRTGPQLAAVVTGHPDRDTGIEVDEVLNFRIDLEALGTADIYRKYFRRTLEDAITEAKAYHTLKGVVIGITSEGWEK